jgi:hypothetical protein
MATLTSLATDDFNTYSSQSDFDNAYPYDPPRDNTSGVTGYGTPTLATKWGMTEGPGGVPGLSSPSRSAGGFDVWVSPSDCYEFQAEGKWDFLWTPSDPDHLGLNDHYTPLDLSWIPPAHRLDDYKNLVKISRRHSAKVLIVAVRTTPARALGSPATHYFQELSGITENDGTQYTIRAHGRRSRLSETSPGVWAPDDSGFLRVTLNGTQIFSFDGPVWNGDGSINPSPYWTNVGFAVAGHFTAMKVWGETGCDPTGPPPLVPDAEKCCSDPATPGQSEPPDPNVPEPDPTVPVPDFEEHCAGTGVVPNAGAGSLGSDVWT